MAILFCEGRRETGREGTGSLVGVREDKEKIGRMRSFLREKNWEKIQRSNRRRKRLSFSLENELR